MSLTRYVSGMVLLAVVFGSKGGSGLGESRAAGD